MAHCSEGLLEDVENSLGELDNLLVLYYHQLHHFFGLSLVLCNVVSHQFHHNLLPMESRLRWFSVNKYDTKMISGTEQPRRVAIS